MMSVTNLDLVVNKLKNVPYKFRREIDRIPIIQTKKEKLYQKLLDNHAKFLPQISIEDRVIVERLQRHGTYVIPIEKLQFVTTGAMIETVNSLVEELKLSVPKHNSNDCEVGLSRAQQLTEHPAILFWALETRLLNIIENYIGLPIMFQGFSMRKSLVDGQQLGVRRWHLDWEDRRTIKIIIYLNDVSEGGGPFEYIPKDVTSKAIKTLNHHDLGFVSDAEMAAIVPKSDWIACLAEKGGAIITDTSNVFHRAQPPTKQERLSITFCYTSMYSQVVWKQRKITLEQQKSIERQLTQRQKNCMFRRSIQAS